MVGRMSWMVRSCVGVGIAGCYAADAVLWGTTALVVVGLSSPVVRVSLGNLLGLGFKSLVRLWRWQAARRLTPSTNHGSARWMAEADAEAAGLFGTSGLIVGKMGGRVLRHPSREANMVVFAPQGAGKGVGIVIPNLLAHPGSVICIDPKGENFARTAESRLKRGPVWVLSMASTGPSHCFNPMDIVVVGSGEEADQAAQLAELMMPHEVTSEGHWRSRAVQWTKGLIAHVAQRFDGEPEFRNLAMVHQYACLSGKRFRRLLDAMEESPLAVVRDTAADMERTMATNEGSGILSSVLKGTEVFSRAHRSGVVCSRSDFALGDLFGVEPVSLFLQVPLGKMAFFAPWLRVMVGLAVHASINPVEAVPAHRPLFLLDEAATLGEVKEIQDTMGQGRAYHQKVFIYQDMAQLKKANPSYATVLANCQINVAFAVNDLDTARVISERLGEETVATRSYGVSSGADALFSHHQNMGQGEHGRRLLQPSEVMTLDDALAVVTMQGLTVKAPLLATRMKYFEEEMFAGQAGAWNESGLSPAHGRVFAGLSGRPRSPVCLEHTDVHRLLDVTCSAPLRLGYEPGLVPASG
jgi:type IV secretion system protein VirD4